MSDLSSRGASPADADAILAVGVARDIEDLGAPDWSLDDVHEELAEAVGGAWVAEDASGGVVAAAMLFGDGHSRVIVHPGACGRGIGTHLRSLVEAEAPAGSVVGQEVSGSNDAARALLEAAGYEVAQHYWRMAVALDGPAVAAPWPDGALVGHAYTGDDLPEAEALVRMAIPDATGNLGTRRIARDLSTVARVEADGSLAGLVLCERREDGQGFVAYLAVVPGWRGRGLGRALLAGTLERMRAAGLAAASLGVNGANRSALALYESLGMRIESSADRYEKRLR
jgi:ribosomal protein S18 acetylase RimI-like enzyme